MRTVDARFGPGTRAWSFDMIAKLSDVPVIEAHVNAAGVERRGDHAAVFLTTRLWL